jgi:SSS family solute:Na+ symporter
MSHLISPLAEAGLNQITLGHVDYLILIVYFAFVLGIGFILKRFTNSSEDFFLSGRSIPAWITGLAFISANLGAVEVLGMGASGAKYGIMTSHFYWVGAIPAMVFVGIFMMPFYYGSKARSVPEYLKLRFDDKTRVVNAFTFAAMTVMASGASMYALAKLLNLLLGWNFHVALLASAVIVLVYITMGGLTSAIYNEVLQFFLIVLGFIPLVYLGLHDVGGWHGLVDRLNAYSATQHSPITHQAYATGTWTESWSHMGNPADNPMGVDAFTMIFGLGFVLSFGYWCTDFLVVQRAMAADSMSAARRTPLIAAFPKMLFPALVILPGLIAVVLTHKAGSHFTVPLKDDGSYDYDSVVPLMLGHYFPSGLLGLGLTALMASFMSGMAGNVTAFNTVFTYDLYQGYLVKGKPDSHYLMVGRVTTVVGILVSILAAYAAVQFNNLMDILQLVFGLVNAPLFATFLLGMFWKRATGNGAFYGLITGTLAAALHWAVTAPAGSTAWIKGGALARMTGHTPHIYPVEMAQNFRAAMWAFGACFVVTVVISLLTPQRKSDEELKGLVYSLTPKIKETGVPWFKQPAVLGVIVLIATAILNIIFW